MRVFTPLILYHVVSVHCFWSSNRWNDDFDANQLDNMFNGLLNDLSLDISFPPNTNTFVGNNNDDDFFLDAPNPDYMDIDTDYYVDASPSSMLRFPSFITNFRASPPMASNPPPLYLMVQSADIHPKTSTYTLTKTNRVGGDTWRYTMDTDGDNNMFSNIWSSHKMYLCHNAECSQENGVEMTNAFDQSGASFVYDKYPNNYVHLVPTSTLEPLEPLATDFYDEEYEDGYYNFDNILDTISNLWSKARSSYDGFLSQWLNYNADPFMETDEDYDSFSYVDNRLPFSYGYDSDADVIYDYDEGSRLDSELNYDEMYDSESDAYDTEEYEHNIGDEVEKEDVEQEEEEELEQIANANKMVEGQVLADTVPDGEDTLVYEEKHDLVVIEMTVIIVLIMICGVLFAGYRFLLSRREKRRENDYYNIDMSAQLLANN